MKITTEINSSYSELKPLVERIAAEGVPSVAECIFSGRNKIYRLKSGDKDLCIKAFRIPSFPNNFIYSNFRESKAKRSFDYAKILIHKDISTPEPIAWIERKKGGQLKESYYISAFSNYPNNLREWQKLSPEERDFLLKSYSEFMLKLHQKGIQHKDLSPGNVLWTLNSDTEKIDFQIIDLNRMTIRQRPLTQKEAFTNFRNINIIEEETQRLGRFYGETIGIDPEKAGEMALKVLQKDRNKKRRLHKIKRILKLSK